MDYNPNAGPRQPVNLGKKMKRVSDINAMGVGAGVGTVNPNQFMPTGNYMQPQDPYGNGGVPQQQNYGFQVSPSPVPSPQPQQQYSNFGQSPQAMPGGGGFPQQPTGFPQPGFNPQFSMFQQPIVQDMAMQYGQKLADQGKQMVESTFEKWIPVTKLKYYFAVDNNYVINKLRLIFFPFMHKNWALQYDQDNPVQPRFDINAPDLYIPTMAYITYIVVAGFMLGMQNRFSPEQLGYTASSALASSIFELIVYAIVMYVVNISTNIKTLDLVAFCGYKFVIIVFCTVISIVFQRFGYYAALLYSSVSLAVFLLRSLKTKVMHEPAAANPGGAINYDPYGNPQQQQFDYSTGRKRKVYFLFFVACMQPFIVFFLSKHLYYVGVVSEKA
ncbi:YIF1B family protein [Megaselia abdita]